MKFFFIILTFNFIQVRGFSQVNQVDVVKTVGDEVCSCLADKKKKKEKMLATCMAISITKHQKLVASKYKLTDKSTYEESKKAGVLFKKEVEQYMEKKCNIDFKQSSSKK